MGAGHLARYLQRIFGLLLAGVSPGTKVRGCNIHARCGQDALKRCLLSFCAVPCVRGNTVYQSAIRKIRGGGGRTLEIAGDSGTVDAEVSMNAGRERTHGI